MLAGQTGTQGEFALCKAEWFKELFDKQSSNGNGFLFVRILAFLLLQPELPAYGLFRGYGGSYDAG